MAKNKSTVYLGYEDEEITIKHAALLNSNVNKIGGCADWPSGDIKVPMCPLCGTARPLIVQLYAPLEHSQFHRSLYVFACLNPACSQNSKSWLCMRTQHLEPAQTEVINSTSLSSPGLGKKKKNQKKSSSMADTKKIIWCSGTDDWGDAEAVGTDDRMDTTADEENEENGNVIAKNDNSPLHHHHHQQQQQQQQHDDGVGDMPDCAEEDEDDEDDSNSMENDLICGFGQMDVNSPHAGAEDPNANCAVGIAAAAAANDSECCAATATICAELEGAETDVVLVESPQKPERDLIALLKHTPASVAIGPLAKITDVTLKSYFMAVDLEQRPQHKQDFDGYGGTLSADHIRELYQEYKRQDETKAANSPAHGESHGGGGGSGGGGGAACGSVVAAAAGGGGAGDEHESYEKALPTHGDVIFHQFVCTIQQNPGQILRYSRDTLPMLIAPLAEAVPKCQNCNGETICEVQILPTLIPKLRLQQNDEQAPIEYGNVLVFTCLKSCWDTPDRMRYERVIVQAEK